MSGLPGYLSTARSPHRQRRIPRRRQHRSPHRR